MADPRGNLAITYLAIADRYRPEWVVWENVPGVRSVDGGRAFGAFLGGLGELGYGWAYRSLDAQYFGLAQRRERVFVVGHLGDWRRAAAVLFEPKSLRGDSAPRRETGEGIAPTIASRPTGGGGFGTDFDCDGGLISHALRADGFDASEEGTGRGTPLAFGWNKSAAQTMRVADTTDGLQASGSSNPAVAYSITPSNSNADFNARANDRTQALASGGNAPSARGGDVVMRPTVRRLTPRECERLQGFPDDYTLVPYRDKPAADGPRYKALGNSMAVPAVRWIGERITTVSQCP